MRLYSIGYIICCKLITCADIMGQTPCCLSAPLRLKWYNELVVTSNCFLARTYNCTNDSAECILLYHLRFLSA